MVAAGEDIPPDGGGGGPNLPTVPQYTDEKLAMVMAAMMEELGTGRRNALPLEDGGGKRGPARDTHSISRAAAPNHHSVHPGVSAWHTFQPNDVDEADLQLESIADGNLYRIRRGDSSGLTSGRGRERGSTAARGGHSFTVGRGKFNRGRQSSPHMGSQIGISSMPTSSSNQTTQAYVNDARAFTPLMANIAAKYPAQLDATVARLRSKPDDQIPAQRTLPVLIARQETPSGRQISLLPSPPKTKQIWGENLDPNAFLKFAGLSGIGYKPPQPALSGSIEAVHGPQPHNIKKVLSVFSPVMTGAVALASPSSAAVELSTAVEIKPLDSITSLAPAKIPTRQLAVQQEVGLSGSRWALPSDTELSTSQPIALSPSLATSHTLEKASHGQIFREHLVKVRRENDCYRPGKARLLKNLKTDQDLTLELEQDDSVVVREIVENESLFLHDPNSSTITFRADSLNGLSSPTWIILFQLSYQAKKFHDVVFLNRQGHPTLRPAVQHIVVDQLVTSPQNPVPSKDDTSSNLQPLMADQPTLSSSPPRSIDMRNFADNAYNEVSNNFVPLLAEAMATGPQSVSQSAIQTFSFGSLMEQDTIGLKETPLPLPELQHQNTIFGSHINTQTLNDMAQVGGVAPLIILEEEGEEEEKFETQLDDAARASHELSLSLAEAMSEKTFAFLNASPNGSLLSQLSRLAVKKGAQAAKELTGEEIISSDLYITVAYNFVGTYLSGSDTFSDLPDDFAMELVKQVTRKVLGRAVADREESIPTPVTTSDLPTSNGIEESISRSDMPNEVARLQPDQSSHHLDIVCPAVSNNQLGTVEEKDDKVNPIPIQTSRLTYAMEDLMQLRQNAVKFHREHLSDEVAHLVRPQMTEFNPISAIDTPSGTEAAAQQPGTVVSSQRLASKSAVPQVLTAIKSRTVPTKTAQAQNTDMTAWQNLLGELDVAIVIKPAEVSQDDNDVVETRPMPILVDDSMASSSTSTNTISRPSGFEGLAKTLEGLHLTSVTDEAKPPSRETPKARQMQEGILSRLSSPNLSLPTTRPVLLRVLPVADARFPTIETPLVNSITTPPLSAQTVKTRAESIDAGTLDSHSAANTTEPSSVSSSSGPPIQCSQGPARPTGLRSTTATQVSSNAATKQSTYANFRTATNANLQGMPGLANSKWSSADPDPVPNPAPRVPTPRFAAPQSARRQNFDSYAPDNTRYMHRSGLTNLSNIPGSLPSNPPMLPSIPNVAPIFQTVLVQDNDGTYREVTGMVKAGSIPIIAHMPVPESPPRHSGITPSFPARSDMYNRHMSNASDSSDQHFKPDAVPFRPLPRGRQEVNDTNEAKRALSPVRQGDNVQAKLQSRLNASLTFRGSLSPM